MLRKSWSILGIVLSLAVSPISIVANNEISKHPEQQNKFNGPLTNNTEDGSVTQPEIDKDGGNDSSDDSINQTPIVPPANGNSTQPSDPSTEGNSDPSDDGINGGENSLPPESLEPPEKKQIQLGLELVKDLGEVTYMLRAIVPCTEAEYDTMELMTVSYSLDGEVYTLINYDVDEPLNLLEGVKREGDSFSSIILYSAESPLTEFLKGKYSTIYFKANITGSVYEGESTVAKLEKKPEIKPLPEDYWIDPQYPSELFNVIVDNGQPVYATYSETIYEGVSYQNLMKYLPDEIPMYMQIKSGSDFLMHDHVVFGVEWEISEKISSWNPGIYEFNSKTISRERTSIVEAGLNKYEYTVPDTLVPLHLILTIDKSNGPPVTLPPRPPIDVEEDKDDGSGGNRGNAGSSSASEEKKKAEEQAKQEEAKKLEEEKAKQEETRKLAEELAKQVQLKAELPSEIHSPSTFGYPASNMNKTEQQSKENDSELISVSSQTPQEIASDPLQPLNEHQLPISEVQRFTLDNQEIDKSETPIRSEHYISSNDVLAIVCGITISSLVGISAILTIRRNKRKTKS